MDPTQRKKLSAEDYLAAHRIQWLTEHLTMELVRFKPSDPMTFLSQRMETILKAQDAALTKSNGTEMVTSSVVEYSRPKMIAVLGGPCSGKDLICAYLNDLGMVAINVNDLILFEIKSGSETGKAISDAVSAGNEISAEVIVALLKKSITDHTTGFVINGFPRTLRQLDALEKGLGELTAVLIADCSEEVQRARMAASGVPAAKQDERLEVYLRDTYPVVAYMEALHKVTKIDTEVPKEKMLGAVKRFAWESDE